MVVADVQFARGCILGLTAVEQPQNYHQRLGVNVYYESRPGGARHGFEFASASCNISADILANTVNAAE